MTLSINDRNRGKAINFERIGDRITGVVTDSFEEQKREPGTDELVFWPDGRERMVKVIRITVDGEDRTLYAQGGRYEAVEGEGTSMWQAIVDAIVVAGGTEVAEGSTLELVHSGIGKKTNPAFSAPKLYRARYTPPAARALPVGDLFAPAAAPAAVAPPVSNLFTA